MQKKDSKKMKNIKEIDLDSDEIDSFVKEGKKIFMDNFQSDQAADNYIKKLKMALRQNFFKQLP